MSAVTQYLNLFDAVAPRLACGVGRWVNKAREVPLQLLLSGEDGEANDRFLGPGLTAAFAADWGLNIDRLDWGVSAAASLGCAVPRIPAILVIVAGDSVIVPADVPEGVEILSFRHCPEDVPGPEYGRIMPPEDIAAALNTILVQDGLYIRVKKDVVLDRPIQILNVLNAPVNQMAVRRVFIRMDENARASVLSCDHTQDDAHDYLASRVVEASLASGSRLDWCDLEESTPRTRRVNGFFARLDADATVNANHTTLQGGYTHNSAEVDLLAPGGDASLSGMVIADDRQDTFNRTMVLHKAPHCASRQLYKHIADGEGAVTFDGLVDVRPGAVGTDARQSAHTVLASPGARVHAQPHLVIECDDVKCSHGATTGTLDENALFYMRQRGIPLEEARRMLMQAFMQQVIDTVPIEGLRQSLHTLVARRLAGQRVTCQSCHNNS